MISVVIPCYKAKKTILNVLERIPELVDSIVVVDDKCPEESGKYVQDMCHDPRVNVIYHSQNKGVGGAVITGFLELLKVDQPQIIVKIDADGQMDPAILHHFTTPIEDSLADYTKGNRFYNIEDVLGMPKLRLLGNAGLSFISKLSSGYWSIMDPTNGYFAIHSSVLDRIPLQKLDQRYFFESDMLFRLNLTRAVVRDIPMQARYGDEVSGLSEWRSIFEFSSKHVNRFCKRLLYTYFIRDFNPASLLFVFGLLLFLFGVAWGAHHWVTSVQFGTPATSGTVMLAALPLLLGFQMLLAAFQYDVSHEPQIPMHRFEYSKKTRV